MTWDAYVYDLPLARPYQWAKGTATRRQGILVARRHGDVTGWGEIAFAPHETHDLFTVAKHALQAASSWSPVDRLEGHPRLRSGLAGAWWDLAARLDRDPLARLLAEHTGLGEAARVVAVNGLIETLPPEQAAARATHLVAQGFTTLKIKGSASPNEDAQRVAAVRDAVGQHIALRLDANEAWRPEDAGPALAQLASLALAYVEQPTPASDRPALVRIMRASPVPIALDESATSWEDVAWFVDQGLPTHAIAKPQRLGGPDRAAEFLAQCRDHKVPVTVTNSLESAVGRAHALHVAATLGRDGPAAGLATAGFLAHDVADGPGDAPSLSISERGGLGLRVEEGRLTHVVP